MDALHHLASGFLVALAPINLLWAFAGSVLGTAIGVLPGIGPALTIALLLPVTTKMNPTGAFIMFAGILYGAMYGGSTTSILLNTPGESGAIMTALEGNRMARRGRGAAALATAAIGSFVAGTLATIVLTFAAPTVAELAFVFGPADYFALMVVAFTSVSCVLGASRVRGFVSLFAGLALGVMGIDAQTGQARLTFGSPELLDGMELVVVLVGLFAIGETIYVASRYGGGQILMNPLAGGAWMTGEDWARSWKPWLRGTLLGFPIGALPAGGSEIPTFPRTWSSAGCPPSARSSAARARSRAWPGPRRPTTPRRPASWSRSSRSACRPRRRRRSCSPRSRTTASSPVPTCS